MAEGNTTTKWEVGWEDDTEWIVAVYKSMNTPDQVPLLGYKRISKSDYSERDMTVNDFLKYKRNAKETRR